MREVCRLRCIPKRRTISASPCLSQRIAILSFRIYPMWLCWIIWPVNLSMKDSRAFPLLPFQARLDGTDVRLRGILLVQRLASLVLVFLRMLVSQSSVCFWCFRCCEVTVPSVPTVVRSSRSSLHPTWKRGSLGEMGVPYLVSPLRFLFALNCWCGFRSCLSMGRLGG